MDYNSGKEKEGLLSIGSVAKSFGVNANTIRRIEVAGLIKPAYISESSGYRYYDSNNVMLLAEIFSLRTFGFLYEELRDYYKSPGDYSGLYDKLIEKRQYIDTLIERFHHRLNPSDSQNCQIIHYGEAVCRSMTVTMIPDRELIFDISKEFLFDTIRTGVRINYTRSYMVLLDCMDFRSLSMDAPMNLTFCIPVLDNPNAAGPYLHIPGREALLCTCSDTDSDRQWIRSITEMLETVFTEKNLQQTDACRMVFENCGIMGSTSVHFNNAIRFIVPIG